jgi:hypothetical protein
MKKIKLLVILLICSLTIKAQYYPSFSTMSFYDQFSGKQDMHYNDDWTRDTNGIVLENSILKIKIKNGTTHYVQTGILDLKKDDVISFDHRITNSSGTGSVKVSYVDVSGNIIDIKTFTYNSSNTNTMTDTIKMVGNYKYRIRFTYTKTNGNNTSIFEIISFSAITFTSIDIKPFVEETKPIIKINEDEVSIYNMFGVCVYQGYLSEFYQIGDKGVFYFTNKKKFIIY